MSVALTPCEFDTCPNSAWRARNGQVSGLYYGGAMAMRPWLFPIAFTALLLSGIRAGGAAGSTPGLKTSNCQLPNIAREVRCGQLAVAEDPDHPEGRRILVHFAILKASSDKSLPDPIVVLMGGPGEEAIASADIYAEEFKSLLDDRDLLLVDQRLTGRSAPARCQLYSSKNVAATLRDFFPPAAVEKCRRLLEPLVDLKHYTFPDFARDLEQVRIALGYGQLNLFSGSYGTRAAQAFLRQFPHSVRTNYLGSPVPIDANPIDFAKTEDTALNFTFSNCEKDPTCHAAFPNVRAEFQEVLARLDEGNVSVWPPDSPRSVTLTRGRVVEWIRSKLYRPKDAAEVPLIVHRAFKNDWSPIVAGILSGFAGADEDLSWGLFFSISCSEDMPFLSESDIRAQTEHTALGDYRIRQQQSACRKWPRAALPQGYRNPIHSAVPTLIVTGDLDGGTPLWFADRVAAEFSHQVTVVARGQGHTEWSDCLAGLFARLVRTGSLVELQGASCPPVPTPPFKT